LKRKKKALMRKRYKNPPLIEALCELYIEDAFEACITDQLRNKFEEVKEC